MPDEPVTPATPQAGGTGSTSPQAGNTTPTTPQAGNVKTPLTPEEYERRIAELNKENAGHRTKLKSFEEAEAARQAALLTEQQKLEQRATAAEQQIAQYKQQLVSAEVRLAAKDKGILNPDLIAPYLQGKLEYDDKTGMPTNLEKVLNDVITANPFLVAPQGKPASTGGGASNPGRSAATGAGVIDEAFVRGLTNETYARLTTAERQQVQQVMATMRR